jgi:hypothetical protein
VLTTLLIPALAAAPSGPAANGVAEGVEVQIQVRDIPGDPLAAVRLVLEGRGQTLQTETNSLGLAAFAAVPAGSYRLRAEKDGYRTHVQDLDLTGRPPRTLQFRLVRLVTSTTAKP